MSVVCSDGDWLLSERLSFSCCIDLVGSFTLTEAKALASFELAVDVITVMRYKKFGDVACCDENSADSEIDKAASEALVLVDGASKETS